MFPRREPRLFSNARLRFFADFIPIPRNKLAGDHGGICLPGNLSSYSLSFSHFFFFLFFSFLICCFAMRTMALFSSCFGRYTQSVSKTPKTRVLAAREKAGVALFSSRFRLRLLRSTLLLVAFSSRVCYEIHGPVGRPRISHIRYKRCATTCLSLSPLASF